MTTTTKLLTGVAFFVFVFLARSLTAFAVELPTFVYLGGGHDGDSVGDLIENTTHPNLKNLVIKSYTGGPHFELRPNTASYRLTGSNGCYNNGNCFVDEVWATNAVVSPTLVIARTVNGVERPGLIAVNDRVQQFEGENQCYFDYVLIDDKGDSEKRESFYIAPDKWTLSTIPSNLEKCYAGYSIKNDTLVRTPEHCSSGYNNQTPMVINGSFKVTRDGYVNILTEESIGYASSVSCRPVPIPPTQFSGFLWKIIDGDPVCKTSANAADRAKCKIGTSDIKSGQTVQLVLKYENETQAIKTVNYNAGSSSYSFGSDLIIEKDRKVRICIRNLVPPVDTDSYEIARAHVDGTSVGVDKPNDCTQAFMPDFGESNTVQVGFEFVSAPPDSPWYTTINGDVFAGNGSQVSNIFPSTAVGGTYSKNTVQVLGSVLGDEGVTMLNGGYSEDGLKLTGFTNGSAFPFDASVLMNSTNTTLSTPLSAGIYKVTSAQLQNFLATNTTFTVSNASLGPKLAIIYVTGSGTIEITKNLTSPDTSRLLIVAPEIDFDFKQSTSFGSDGSNPIFEAGIISGKAITFTKANVALPDKAIRYKGFLTTYGTNEAITFNWDRGTNNSLQPSTIVEYDPGFITELSKLAREGGIDTGLTEFDFSWEILD